jgi:hypothetical protein
MGTTYTVVVGLYLARDRSEVAADSQALHQAKLRVQNTLPTFLCCSSIDHEFSVTWYQQSESPLLVV